MLSDSYRAVVASKFEDRDPSIVRAQIDEVCKYLFIISDIQSSRFIPLTRDADEVWHEMIVQTVLYAELYRSLPGRTFIHHESIGMDGYSERVGHRESVAQFLEWVPEYTSRFGPFTIEAAEHWAVVNFLRDEVGLSLEAINALKFENAA